MLEFKFSVIDLDATEKNLAKTLKLKSIEPNIYLYKSYIQNCLTLLCNISISRENYEFTELKEHYFRILNSLHNEFPDCRYMIFLVEYKHTKKQATILFRYFSEFRIQFYSNNAFEISNSDGKNVVIKNPNKLFDEILRIESYDSQTDQIKNFFSNIWQNLTKLSELLEIADKFRLITLFLFLLKKIIEKHIQNSLNNNQENDTKIFESLFEIDKGKFDFINKSLKSEQSFKEIEKILNQYTWCINDFGLIKSLNDYLVLTKYKGNIDAFIYHYMYENIIQPLESLSNRFKDFQISSFKTFDIFLSFLKDAEKKNNVSIQGTFYTDPNIARFIVSRAISLYFDNYSQNFDVKNQKIKILDLCSGTGAFSIALADILATKFFDLNNNIPDYGDKSLIEKDWMDISTFIFKEMIHGVDFNELAISICKTRLFFWSLQKYIPIVTKDRLSENISDNSSNQPLDFTHRLMKLIEILNDNFKCEDIFNTTGSLYKLSSKKEKFDLIVSNPPYIQEKGNKKLLDNALKNSFIKKYYQARMDYYLLFLGWAFEFLQDGGIMAFITPNYFLRNLNGTLIRKAICERARRFYFYDFGEISVFKKAPGHHSAIYFIQLDKKSKKDKKDIGSYFNNSSGFRNKDERFAKFYSIGKTSGNLIQILDLLSFNINMTNFDEKNNPSGKKDLIRELNPKLSSEIYSNFAEGLRIPWKNLFFEKQNFEILSDYDKKIHPKLMSISNKFHPLSYYAEVKQGIITGPDRLNRKNEKLLDLSKNESKKIKKSNRGVFILENEELNRLNLNKEEEKFIHPFFYPKDITKQIYLNQEQISDEVKNFVLYIDRKSNLDPERHGNILKHLMQFKPIMDSRRETKKGKIKWYELHWPRERYLFESPRIISIRMTAEPRFIYSEIPFVTDLSTNIVVTKDIGQLLTIFFALNCDIAKLWIRKFAKYKGNQLQIDGKFLESLPIPKLDLELEETLQILIKLSSEKSYSKIGSDLSKFLNFAFNEIYLFESTSLLTLIQEYIKKSGSFKKVADTKDLKTKDTLEFHKFLLNELKTEYTKDFTISE